MKTTQTTSSLLTPLVVGSHYTTTAPDFRKYNVTQVTYIGDHGTAHNDYYLFEGLTQNLEKKSVNYSKNQFDLGRFDHYFNPTSLIISASVYTEGTSSHVQ